MEVSNTSLQGRNACGNACLSQSDHPSALHATYSPVQAAVPDVLSKLRRFADTCALLCGRELGNSLERAAATAARTGLFLSLDTVAKGQAFAAEREALGAPEEQRRFAATIVAAPEDQLAALPLQAVGRVAGDCSLAIRTGTVGLLSRQEALGGRYACLSGTVCLLKFWLPLPPKAAALPLEPRQPLPRQPSHPLPPCTAAEDDATVWSDGLYQALQATELPLFKPAMYDAAPDAPGLCCPGRAQHLLDAAQQALAAAPLARPASMPAAQHLHMMSVLVLAVFGLADWALPQWGVAEDAGLVESPACLCCGG